MPNRADIDAIVEGLSEAQKRWLTTEARWIRPSPMADECWMTFPPKNTLEVLHRLGLVLWIGLITYPLGLSVRSALLEARER